MSDVPGYRSDEGAQLVAILDRYRYDHLSGDTLDALLRELRALFGCPPAPESPTDE